MRKLISGLCVAMAAAFTGPLPLAAAGPMFVPKVSDIPTDVQKVQGEWWMGGSRARGMRGGGGWEGRAWRGGGGWERRGWNRGWDRRAGWDRGWHGARPYYRGYRGYRYYRPGYRYYNDFWFPGAAFATGAIIGGIIANSQPTYRYSDGGSAHERWCYNRYRSYRAWDNTFQPYNGPRRQCYSPYN
ncbi:BA14K family protein [Mesorhizobium sp. 1B3]